MLGKLIAEGKGKRSYRRVLDAGATGFKVEVAFESQGKMLGLDSMEVGTYVSETRPDGTLIGQGKGVILTKSGAISWIGHGTGTVDAKGNASYRGSVLYSTPDPKLAKQLHGCAGVFEFSADAEGNTHAKVWEWK
jgi:hypothetical protein